MTRRPLRDRRAYWEKRWRLRPEKEFPWSLSEPLRVIKELVETGRVPEGGALDVGCGAGRGTVFLAERFQPSIGIDLAWGAIAEARRQASGGRRHPRFVLAAAPAFPFGDGCFSLIFDKGCLQMIPRGLWGTYFAECRRVLKTGGLLVLYMGSTSAWRRLLYDGLRGRARSIAYLVSLRWLLRRIPGLPGAPPKSPSLLRRLLPEGLALVDAGEAPRRRSPRKTLYLLAERR